MRAKYIKWLLLIITLVCLIVVTILLSLTIGEFNIKLQDVLAIFQSKTGMEYTILSQIRLPRILLAFSIGGSLSLTGAILQGIYRNPLVEPFTLGISGGAALGIAFTIVFGLHLTLGALVLPLSGFIGSLFTIFLVYILSLKKGELNINRMLLIGVMISFIASSAMMLLMSISSADDIHSIIFWIMGSLDEPNTTLINIMLYASIAGLFIAVLFSRSLNALRLGEVKAKHLGFNASITIRILFIVASLLTGICVSVAGIIGFVGLIIPHIIRMLIGSDYRISLLASFLGGSLFLLICDIIARTIIAPNELPIGVITGLAGGLMFILVLSRQSLKSKLS